MLLIKSKSGRRVIDVNGRFIYKIEKSKDGYDLIVSSMDTGHENILFSYSDYNISKNKLDEILCALVGGLDITVEL